MSQKRPQKQKQTKDGEPATKKNKKSTQKPRTSSNKSPLLTKSPLPAATAQSRLSVGPLSPLPAATAKSPPVAGPLSPLPAATAKSPPGVCPQPGCSYIFVEPEVPEESEIDDSIDEEELCCVCKRFSPLGMQQRPDITILSWAQCDLCNHWTHLKFCSAVTRVENGDQFFCPHCEKED